MTIFVGAAILNSAKKFVKRPWNKYSTKISKYISKLFTGTRNKRQLNNELKTVYKSAGRSKDTKRQTAESKAASEQRKDFREGNV